MTETAVYAAGGVIWRVIGGRLHVLLIHRTQYRDVTLPKGKVDPGESLPETAVREIREETGLSVVLGVPVGLSSYRLPSKRKKIVHYWAAHASEDAVRASTFVPNNEIAAVEWVRADRAEDRLSYPVDVEILQNFLSLVDDGILGTFPLIVLRHAKAQAREDWSKPDAARPLTGRGSKQAQAVAAQLRAFGVKRIISSPAVRCVATAQPLADSLGKKVRTSALISQDAWEEGSADPRRVVGKRVRAGKPAVFVSHGPVLPDLMTEIALATATPTGRYVDESTALEPAAFSVVHINAGHPGSGIVAIETHQPKL